ncbi:MAG: tRNA pseudouridine(55) synthase TruB [Chlorobiaceae bacterium]|jgi:tRNA pseudouridine55 synthase|nr:tRNA pseudouridine(55) synthase TruB [Chlorobiaceae bacterium]NTV16302.1 tRNA pseudouridine(55) synthase TruB [Chlorobiaceae bacterium]
MDEQRNREPLPDEGNFLLIDKPLDWTSFDVVAKIRNTYKHAGMKRKVGHCGTLDPKATGLLILATGRKTKEISSLEVLDKVYDGAIKLGAMTDSHDIETAEYGHCATAHLTENDIRSAASAFIGKHQQQPPMHSAAWHNGKRLYEHARKGEVIRERKAKEIVIHRFEVTRIELPVVYFMLHVSKGAYIRVIAHEFGSALGVGGYLASLRRVSVGPYELSSARTVSESIEAILQEVSNTPSG